MRDILLHTPEGVRDIYGIECARKVRLQDMLSQVFGQYGYHRIQTPAFEFFDIFNGERGTVKSREMYKFFDREGNTLVLRPDITPSIARAVAKYYGDEKIPLRFCYMGNVFINNSSYQGLMKESTQMGAELIGSDSPQADGEMIALSIELLKKSGLDKFVLDIGHAGFFRGFHQAAVAQGEHLDKIKNPPQQRHPLIPAGGRVLPGFQVDLPVGPPHRHGAEERPAHHDPFDQRLAPDTGFFRSLCSWFQCGDCSFPDPIIPCRGAGCRPPALPAGGSAP